MGFAWIGTVGSLFINTDNAEYVMFSEEGTPSPPSPPHIFLQRWGGVKGNVPHIHKDGWHSLPKFYNHKPSEPRAGELNCLCQQCPSCDMQHFISRGTAAHWQGNCREGFRNALTEERSACVMASLGRIWGEVLARERRRQSERDKCCISVVWKQRILIFLFEASSKKPLWPSQSLI